MQNKLNPFIVGGIVLLISLGISFASANQKKNPAAQAPSTVQTSNEEAASVTPASANNVNTTSKTVNTANGTITTITTTVTTNATTKPAATSTASKPPSSSTSQTSTVKQYKMFEVATHNSQSDCWSAINGGVYNLTSWISQHLGGKQAILSLCGKDGSEEFDEQHGGQSRPANELAGYKIGVLIK